MEIRYLDLGEVTPEIYTALWEYDSVIELNEPTLIKFSPNTKIVQFFQGPYWDEELQDWKNDFTNLSEFYNSEILKDVIISRCYVPIEINYSAEISYYIATPDGTDFILYLPDMGVLSEKDKRQEIDFIFKNILIQALSEKNIDSKVGGNDVIFELNGNYKKFSGSLYRPATDGYGSNDIGITYKFDFKLANKLREISTEIKIKKFDVKDVSDVVGGLWEVDSTIDRDELDFEVVQRMSNHLGYTIRQDTLTYDEENLLFERGHRRMTEKEWYLYGNNDGFDIYS